jgi:hypothetical protein
VTRLLFVLALAASAAACSDGPFQPTDPVDELAGTYYAESLDGWPVPDESHPLLEATLVLRRDGTFSEWWTLVNDHHEFHGRWHLVGEHVTFTMEGEFLERATIYGRRLELTESGITYVRERTGYY